MVQRSEKPELAPAGTKGVGAPVAPPEWKWRCGKRTGDMYFYSPTGLMFASRKTLANFLTTHRPGPSPDDFCWKVTNNMLEPPMLTGEAFSANFRENSPSRNKSTDVHMKKQMKIESATPSRNKLADVHMKKQKQIESATPLRNKLADVHMKKQNKIESATSRTFKEILANRSSCEWLQDSQTEKTFLEEARMLHDLSAEEIGDMRNLLVTTLLQMEDFIKKYPVSVLRVFLRLLGTDGLSNEPSETLSLVELVDLCKKMARA